MTESVAAGADVARMSGKEVQSARVITLDKGGCGNFIEDVHGVLRSRQRERASFESARPIINLAFVSSVVVVIVVVSGRPQSPIVVLTLGTNTLMPSRLTLVVSILEMEPAASAPSRNCSLAVRNRASRRRSSSSPSGDLSDGDAPIDTAPAGNRNRSNQYELELRS